jgi:hypothetical protein
MANDSDRIAELTAQLQNQQHAARFRFGFLLVLMAGLALTIWLRPQTASKHPLRWCGNKPTVFPHQCKDAKQSKTSNYSL